MKQHRLIPHSGKLKRYIYEEEELPALVGELKGKMEKCRLLRLSKVGWNKIRKVVEMGRSNYYRIKKKVRDKGYKGYIRESSKPHSYRMSKISDSVRDLILRIRKENHTYGKSKIVVIIKRDHGVKISESSVGRILKDLMIRGKISRYISSRKKRKRRFNKHAIRWEYGKVVNDPGEMIQIDHMSVSKNQKSLKHFQAWDPITKTIVADVSSNAKSITAKRFLEKLIEELR